MRISKEQLKALCKQAFAKYCVVRVGSNRVVLDFFRLKLVVKLPIVHLIIFAKELALFPKGLQEISFLKWVCLPIHCDGYAVGCRRLLFKGIADNWGEFWFSLLGEHPFVRETPFSVFGLINVQRTGDQVPLSRGTFKARVKRIIGEEAFDSDSHHFSSPSNFCLVDGRLRMVDFGDPRTRRVIQEVGICLYNNFRCDNDAE